MERLRARGRALAEQRAMEVRKQIAGRARDALPGVAVEIEGESVVLSGHRLWARMMREPVLRWIGSVLR